MLVYPVQPQLQKVYIRIWAAKERRKFIVAKSCQKRFYPRPRDPRRDLQEIITLTRHCQQL